MVQIIKSVNLRDIHRKGIGEESYPQFTLPFVSRHVEGIPVCFSIFFQLLQQHFVLHSVCPPDVCSSDGALPRHPSCPAASHYGSAISSGSVDVHVSFPDAAS